jgi:hypothetical protein
VDADQVTRIALTVITPILTAGIGIVVLVIGDWRERKTQAGQRKLAFDDASRQVAFAADWWNASKLIADSPDAEQQAATQAQAWLDEASALVAESKPPPVDDKPAITLRRLLLAYPMQRRGARILRALFYFSLGAVAFQVSGAMASALGRPDTLGIPNYFSGGFIYGDLIAVAVVTVIAMTLRFWSLRVEKSQPTEQSRSPLTLRRALLLYRFNRPAATIARIVFWFWAASTILVVIAAVLGAFDEPQLIPSSLVGLIAWVGWAIGLRYWAASLNECRTINAGRAASDTTTPGARRQVASVSNGVVAGGSGGATG